MYGRKVGSSLLRFHLPTRLPIRSNPFQSSTDTLSRAVVLLQQSAHYATPGRPRKTVGEPSKTVKRAVKLTPKDPNDPATKKVAAKKKSAKAKPKAKTKAKAKTKPRAKPAKKPLTEAQTATRAANAEKKKIRELKKAALSPPRTRSLTAYLTFTQEKMNESKPANTEDANARLKSIAAEYRQLSAADIEHYNHLAHTAAENDRAAYKTWVEQHTVEEIEAANRARAQLRRMLGDKLKNGRYANIKDERHVKRPTSPFLHFSINRNASGDFRNISLAERAKLIGQEWKALDESEKKKYVDLQRQDQNRYSEEFNNVHGHSPPYLRMNGEQAAAATA